MLCWELGMEKLNWWDFYLGFYLPRWELSASSTACFFFFLPPHSTHHCHAA